MSLESVINVTITSNSLTGTTKSFGVPLVVGYHTAYSDRTKTYESASAKTQLVADGIPSTHPIYKSVNSILQASPSPESVVVGRLSGTFDQLCTIQVVAVPNEGRVYSLVVRNAAGVETTVSYTALAGDTVDEIATGLNVGMTAISGITSTATTDTMSIVVDTTSETWTFDIDDSVYAFQDNTVAPTDVTLATDLAAILDDNGVWYGMEYAGPNSTAINMAIAAWNESYEKIFLGISHDAREGDAASTTSFAYLAKAAAYFRTVAQYSGDQKSHAGGAWIGKMLPTYPGAATWEFKILSGTIGDYISGDMRTSFEQNNNAYYELNWGGYPGATLNSKTAGGEFIDVVVFRDWLVARLREYIANLLMNTPKVPYTDPGVEMVLKEIRAVLRLGAARGGIDDATDPVVTGSKVADVSTTNKANRLLPDVHFSAQLAGAIHALNLNGALLV